MKPKLLSQPLSLILFLELIYSVLCQMESIDHRGQYCVNGLMGKLEIREWLQQVPEKGIISMPDPSTQYARDFISRSLKYLNTLQARGYWHKEENKIAPSSRRYIQWKRDLMYSFFLDSRRSKASLDKELDLNFYLRNYDNSNTSTLLILKNYEKLTFDPSTSTLKGTDIKTWMYSCENKTVDKYNPYNVTKLSDNCTFDLYITFKDFYSGEAINLSEKKLLDTIYYHVEGNSKNCNFYFNSTDLYFTPVKNEYANYILSLTVCYLMSFISSFLLVQKNTQTEGLTLKGISSCSLVIILTGNFLFAFNGYSFAMVLDRFYHKFVSLAFILASLTSTWMIFQQRVPNAQAPGEQNALNIEDMNACQELILHGGLALIIGTFAAKCLFNGASDWFMLPLAFYLVPQIIQASHKEYKFSYFHVIGMMPPTLYSVVYARLYSENVFMKEENPIFVKTFVAIVVIQVIILLFQGKVINISWKRQEAHVRMEERGIEMRGEG